MRMVEPELPQSNGVAGWIKEPAVPVIAMVLSGLCTTVAPRACMQAREEWGSAPVEKLERRVVPSAMPASMAYRWEMDLSPDGSTPPVRCFAGCMVCFFTPRF